MPHREHIALALAAAAALAAGCSDQPSIVGCADSTICTLQPGGQCLAAPVGFDVCAYPNAECPSGFSWSPQAGDLAGECVPNGTEDAATDATDAASTDAIDAPIEGPAPVLHWTLDGNLDNSGLLAGHALSNPSGLTYGPGKVGQGALLNGYAFVDNMRTSLSTYPKVTIGMWVYEPGNLANKPLVDCNNRSAAPYGGVLLGLNGASSFLCVSTPTMAHVGGTCLSVTFDAPSANAWHHWLIRYDGTGTAPGQGAAVEIYVDNVLVHTRPNDSLDPVFTAEGTPDRLYLGTTGVHLDDVRIYNQVFTPAEQCMHVIRGTWNGNSCTMP